ncbi:MAG: LysM peptidoglycan-binding domain-containing protein [Desulfatiglandales bacterium]
MNPLINARFYLYCALLLLLSTALAQRSYAQKPLTYTVKGGDTLSAIALRYQVSVDQLRKWNGLSDDKLTRGQQLTLWPHGRPGWYVVRSGENLSEIGLRFDVSIATLRRLNGISGDRIYPGQRIMLQDLPVKAEVSQTYKVKHGDTLWKVAGLFGLSVPELKELNNIRGDRIFPGKLLVVGAAEEEAVPEAEPFEYVVKKGETLSEIAQRHKVSTGLIRQLNSLTGDRINPGDRLQLQPSSLEEAVHIVRPGETLSAIALKYRTAVADLMEINGLGGTKIQVGQKLRLKAASGQTHIVERGDALWEIASAYGVTVDAIKALNGLTSDLIYPGQELQLGGQVLAYQGIYRVRSGDYLEKIARLHQMSVAEIKDVNSLKTSVIHPGDRLRVRPLLDRGNALQQTRLIPWEGLLPSPKGIVKIHAQNGPYYFRRPQARSQPQADYYERPDGTPLGNYQQARALWRAFEREVSRLPRISNALLGWHFVLDPGHGGLDPGAIVRSLDGGGRPVYVVEDEYVYDVALRVFVLLRLFGADATMTLLSPNHLIRRSDPATETFVNEKNEVYNSYELNKKNKWRCWPCGGNLQHRVKIAQEAFRGIPKDRRIFLSFHADIEPTFPDAAMVLYYKSRTRQDLRSKKFAEHLLPALGAGAHVRGRNLGVLRDNPAGASVLIEIRNLAHIDHAWALRFEELRQRDAEKVVKGLLDYVGHPVRTAMDENRLNSLARSRD